MRPIDGDALRTMTKDEYHAYLHDQIESIDTLIERFSENGSSAMTAIAILICERDRLVDKVFEFECEST